MLEELEYITMVVLLLMVLVSAVVFGNYIYDKLLKKQIEQTIIFNYGCEVETNEL